MKNNKLDALHKEIKANNAIKQEGMISDYAFYALFKTFFNVPNLTFYQFGAVKDLIKKNLRR